MIRRFITAILIFALTVLVGLVVVGEGMGHPYHREVGPPPADFPAEEVAFPSESGATIHGWFLRGKPGGGAVMIMHGVKDTRLSMVERARILHQGGYTVLLFDFQAHGESHGDRITFGYLESRDARAALNFLRSQVPGEPIGILGFSMGGAAALLGDGPLKVDALILEAVFPSADSAMSNRFRIYLHGPGPLLTPLQMTLFRLRYGVSSSLLRPLNRIGQVHFPVLIINGTRDRHNTPEDARLLFENANEPKELWLVEGATHLNLDRHARAEYRRRILDFFGKYLRETRGASANGRPLFEISRQKVGHRPTPHGSWV